MLGRALLQVLGREEGLTVIAASRTPVTVEERIESITGVDVLNADELVAAFAKARPDVVINAVGLIKQREDANNPLHTVPLNTLLPFRLADLCSAVGARLILISTDCVFYGDRGGYRESDVPDARDLYGVSKLLGEVVDRPNVITLRTSIIGRERGSARGLIEWFMQAGDTVNGYRHAVFSGFPTVVLAEIIRDFVLPDQGLHGLYHVSADPIDKLSLLQLTSEVYGMTKSIRPVDEPRIDRSLNSDRFRAQTGFSPAPWKAMIERMRELQG